MADNDSELNNEQSEEETDGEETDSSSQDSDLFGDMEIPPELDEVKKNMQRGFTRKMTQLAQEKREILEQMADITSKARAYDNLSQNPNFMKAIQKVTSEEDYGDDDSDDGIDYSGYGEKAGELKELVGLLSKASTAKAVKAIEKMLKPVLGKLEQDNTSGRLNSLKSWVKDQTEKTGLDLPDPSRYEIEIKDFMDKGFTAEQAYRAAVDFSNVKIRKAGQSNGIKKQSKTLAPGGSSAGNASPKVKFTVDTVMAMKNKGEKMPTIDDLIQMAREGKL